MKLLLTDFVFARFSFLYIYIYIYTYTCIYKYIYIYIYIYGFCGPCGLLVGSEMSYNAVFSYVLRVGAFTKFAIFETRIF